MRKMEVDRVRASPCRKPELDPQHSSETLVPLTIWSTPSLRTKSPELPKLPRSLFNYVAKARSVVDSYVQPQLPLSI